MIDHEAYETGYDDAARHSEMTIRRLRLERNIYSVGLRNFIRHLVSKCREANQLRKEYNDDAPDLACTLNRSYEIYRSTLSEAVAVWRKAAK